MDKTEKLALARKKLRKFQAKSSSSSVGDSSLQKEINGIHDSTPKLTKLFNDDNLGLSPQVHSQSIDILVSEKTGLMQKLSQTELELRQRQEECFSLQNNISILKRQFEETGRERDRLVEELERKNRILSQSSISDKDLRTSLQKTEKNLEDLSLENSELLSRVTTQSKELLELSRTKEELEKKLAMQEVLVQQLQSSSSQPTTPLVDKGSEKIEELEGEVSKLSASLQLVRRERDQSVSDVAALREALLNSQQENARKVGQLQTLVKESEIEINSLTQQLTSLSNTSDSRNEKVSSLRQSLDSITTERDDLKTRMQQLVSDNAQLSQLYSSSEDTVARLEGELSRVRGEVVDQQSLMATISQDKESISRAVAQNKDLKEQLAELQEAYVQKSHQNMELASSLDSEKYRGQKLAQRVTEMEEELTEERRRGGETVKELEVLKGEGAGLKKEEPKEIAVSIPEVGENGRGSRGVESVDTSQIQELSMECASLREERDKLLEELRRLSSPSPTSSTAMDQEEDNSLGNISLLQQSFSALQERFTFVMKDKADLLDRLQVMEHTIVQLSGENETIAEYVTLYQTQREALKVKFSEKDRTIEQLQQEKNNLQLKLREVQSMVSQLDHEPFSSSSLPSQHHNSQSPQPPPSHHPSLPAHVSSERGVVSQIVSLIEEELTYPSSSGLTTTAQCPCCSGQLIVV